MSPGDILPLLSSLMGADGSGELPVLGAKVGSLVYFSLECTGSRVRPKERGLLGESTWLFSSSSESSRCIRGCMKISSSLESLSSLSVTIVPGGW